MEFIKNYWLCIATGLGGVGVETYFGVGSKALEILEIILG